MNIIIFQIVLLVSVSSISLERKRNKKHNKINKNDYFDDSDFMVSNNEQVCRLEMIMKKPDEIIKVFEQVVQVMGNDCFCKYELVQNSDEQTCDNLLNNNNILTNFQVMKEKRKRRLKKKNLSGPNWWIRFKRYSMQSFNSYHQSQMACFNMCSRIPKQQISIPQTFRIN